MADEKFLYFVRKRKQFWGSTRYEYTHYDTPGRARGAVKSSLSQGHVPLEPIKIYKIPVSAMEEIDSIEGDKNDAARPNPWA